MAACRSASTLRASSSLRGLSTRRRRPPEAAASSVDMLKVTKRTSLRVGATESLGMHGLLWMTGLNRTGVARTSAGRAISEVCTEAHAERVAYLAGSFKGRPMQRPRLQQLVLGGSGRSQARQDDDAMPIIGTHERSLQGVN